MGHYQGGGLPPLDSPMLMAKPLAALLPLDPRATMGFMVPSARYGAASEGHAVAAQKAYVGFKPKEVAEKYKDGSHHRTGGRGSATAGEAHRGVQGRAGTSPAIDHL